MKMIIHLNYKAKSYYNKLRETEFGKMIKMYDNANNDSLWPYFKDDSNFNLKTTMRPFDVRPANL